MKNKKIKGGILKQVLDNLDPSTRQSVDNRMYLAVMIQDILTKRGMKKKDLAAMLNKNASEISKWLSGDHNFTIDTLSEIGTALGVNLLQNKSVEAA